MSRREVKIERAHTVEVSRPHKGNVNAEVAVVGRAIEAEVDAKGDRGPCWVLLAAVEADLLIAGARQQLAFWMSRIDRCSRGRIPCWLASP